MSDTATTPLTQIPALKESDLCHLITWMEPGNVHATCGAAAETSCRTEWHGEEHCPTCRKRVCPECIQMFLQRNGGEPPS